MPQGFFDRATVLGMPAAFDLTSFPHRVAAVAMQYHRASRRVSAQGCVSKPGRTPSVSVTTGCLVAPAFAKARMARVKTLAACSNKAGGKPRKAGHRYEHNDCVFAACAHDLHV